MVRLLILKAKFGSFRARCRALEKLCSIKSEKSADVLMNALIVGYWELSGAIIGALGEIGDPRAARAVVSHLRASAEYPGVARWREAREALPKFGDASVEALLAQMRDPWLSAGMEECLRRVLEESGTRLSEESLRLVAGIQGVTVNRGRDEKRKNPPLDCAETIALARRELVRRGLDV